MFRYFLYTFSINIIYRQSKLLFYDIHLEFSSQLPHDGGAFYTTDTMESARPHYVESWAPILHAATLWLNARGFEMSDNQEKTTANTTNNNNHNNNNNNEAATSKTNMNIERFHLLFGKYYTIYII